MSRRDRDRNLLYLHTILEDISAHSRRDENERKKKPVCECGDVRKKYAPFSRGDPPKSAAVTEFFFGENVRRDNV